MDYYSSSLANNSRGLGHSTFYGSLIACFVSLLKEAPEFATLNLRTPTEPDADSIRHGRTADIWSTDLLLVYKGTPVAAVCIEVVASLPVLPPGDMFQQAIAATVSNAARAVEKIGGALAARIAEAVEGAKPPKPETPERVPKVMRELSWRITVRTSTQVQDEASFSGGPFDMPAIETAFDCISNLIVAAVRADAAKANKLQPAAVV